jgi:murein DD-endopeptidase MepM/ murein hydrolase activator NlpD
VLPAPAGAAAANSGGAAPGSGGGGSSVSVSGGAAPGAKPFAPRKRASSARTGGAVPGHRPAVRRRKRKPRPKPKPKVVRPKAKPVPPSAPAGPTVAGVFPLVGTYSFGGPDARFGAQRNGHIHQGQDVIAASGTPIVAPIAGSVLWTGDQPSGAGIYVVLHGGDGRDYVFMHILAGTLRVAMGDAVRAGEQLAEVGATGDAQGPHLHFEIWVDGWGTTTGRPIDPLPQLQRWAAGG